MKKKLSKLSSGKHYLEDFSISKKILVMNSIFPKSAQVIRIAEIHDFQQGRFFSLGKTHQKMRVFLQT